MGHDDQCVGETSVGYIPPKISCEGSNPEQEEREAVGSPSEAILAVAERVESSPPEMLAISGVNGGSEEAIAQASGREASGETACSMLADVEGGTTLDEYISMQDLSDETVRLSDSMDEDGWLDTAYSQLRTGCCWPWACYQAGHRYQGLPHDEFDLTAGLNSAPPTANRCCSCAQSMSCCGSQPVMSSWCLFQVNRLLPESVAESLGWSRWSWYTKS
eukprot:TRINITY_DN1269_c0_g1_i2.p1 TRINITY_DN1269_c0_g1~~TRINITY_DN1269_c0_g1_i2.p1  ORF type:complete len:218 (+),score=23.41 TRINITY_DN1269_c0_g1_i2:100-753(+)